VSSRGGYSILYPSLIRALAYEGQIFPSHLEVAVGRQHGMKVWVLIRNTGDRSAACTHETEQERARHVARRAGATSLIPRVRSRTSPVSASHAFRKKNRVLTSSRVSFMPTAAASRACSSPPPSGSCPCRSWCGRRSRSGAGTTPWPSGRGSATTTPVSA
jgi:hypothetical protein